MNPLSEYEIHAAVDDGIEAFPIIIHSPCGASLGAWDMIDLEDAVTLAVNHVCEPNT